VDVLVQEPCRAHKESWYPHTKCTPPSTSIFCGVQDLHERGGRVGYLVSCRENRWETCTISGSDMVMQCKCRHSTSTSRLLGTRQRLTDPVFHTRFQGTGRRIGPLRFYPRMRGRGGGEGHGTKLVFRGRRANAGRVASCGGE
jgi:hypothetical protein